MAKPKLTPEEARAYAALARAARRLRRAQECAERRRTMIPERPTARQGGGDAR